MTDFLDDDENVKDMRQTARTIGLTDVIVRAVNCDDVEQARELLRKALDLLGASKESR